MSIRPPKLFGPLLLLYTAIILVLSPLPAVAIKFSLPALRFPPQKCIWHTVHTNTLVIVTVNVGAGKHQKVDVEIQDSSAQKNVYLSKRDIKGETRLAITTHAEGEVGVCLTNTLQPTAQSAHEEKLFVVVDLDVDIGADAVDYNAIANQESLSGLEVEMRKLEGVTKEIVDELEYLQKREERFTSTNTSTNERVEKFAWFTLLALAGLGAWQIMHLRSFFKRKYLID